MESMRSLFQFLLIVLVGLSSIPSVAARVVRHVHHHGQSRHRAAAPERKSQPSGHATGRIGRARRRMPRHRETAAERKRRLHALALKRHPYSMGPVVPEISPERATAIQEALARAGYAVPPSGAWDAATEDAMRRFQTVHHWQHKFVPDARALIALGLGPKYDQPGTATGR